MVTARLAHGPTGDGVDGDLDTGPTAHVDARLPDTPTAHVTATLEGT